MRDSSAFGQSCGNLQQIKIDSEISDQMASQTFIHEILHAIEFTYNLEIDHKLIHQLETALYAFVVDNPEVFK